MIYFVHLFAFAFVVAILALVAVGLIPVAAFVVKVGDDLRWMVGGLVVFVFAYAPALSIFIAWLVGPMATEWGFT